MGSWRSLQKSPVIIILNDYTDGAQKLFLLLWFILVIYFNFVYHFSEVDYASVKTFAHLLIYLCLIDVDFVKTKNLNITWTCLIKRGLYEDM